MGKPVRGRASGGQGGVGGEGTVVVVRCRGPRDGQQGQSILRFHDWNPAEIRPGSPISGPEALLRSIGYGRSLR